jgi:transcriptional regulator with XRE-family HTH domain
MENWYDDAHATLGDRITAARESAGLSDAELAQRLGVRLVTLRGWENDAAEPRANRAQMLAALLGVSLIWLLTGQGEGPDPESTTADHAVLGELRALHAQALALTRRIAHLEKKLRAAKEAGHE